MDEFGLSAATIAILRSIMKITGETQEAILSRLIHTEAVRLNSPIFEEWRIAKLNRQERDLRNGEALARMIWAISETEGRPKVTKAELVSLWQITDQAEYKKSDKTVSEIISRICSQNGGKLSFEEGGARFSYIRYAEGRKTIFMLEEGTLNGL